MTMTADFLVIGESVADIVREPGRPDVTHPGGSPANVAYGLARLGRETALLTELGADPAGELIAARLREAGVELLACRSQPAGRRRNCERTRQCREGASRRRRVRPGSSPAMEARDTGGGA